MTPDTRKEYPVGTGVIDYFPRALLEIAHVSFIGNQQHNPGTPLHWDRSKSTDEADALMRHFLQRGSFDTDGLRHSAKLSWRSLALLQKELEAAGRVLVFGKRTVLGLAERSRGKQRWRVRCACGHEFTCLTQDLRRKGGAGCFRCVHKGPRESRRKRPYEYRYNAAKNRARHPVLLSYEEFFALTKECECHYCGAPISWGDPFGKDRPSGLNLDRKDNNQPYTVGNVVVACRRCNYAKNAFFSYEEWKELGTLIRDQRERKKNRRALALLQKELEMAEESR